MFVIAAAFETLSGLAFIRNKAVETRAQKRLKARFARVVVGEVVFLKRIREETLRQIFRVFVIGLPLEAHVFVNGFPVALEDRFERALPHAVVCAAGAHDRRLVRLRKAMLRAADVGIGIHTRVRIFWPSRQDCFTLRTHEAIPSHLRTGHARRVLAHRPVYGSFSRTPEKHGRWSTNALSHAPHLHPVLRAAAPRYRHVLSLSPRSEATHFTDRW